VEKVEDRLNERLELGDCNLISMMKSCMFDLKKHLTGRSALVGQKDTTPGIHDTLTERNDVINHVVWEVRAGGDTGGLLEDLANNRQISVKVGSDGLGDVTEGLENRGLKLVAGGLSES